VHVFPSRWWGPVGTYLASALNLVEEKDLSLFMWILYRVSFIWVNTKSFLYKLFCETTTCQVKWSPIMHSFKNSDGPQPWVNSLLWWHILCTRHGYRLYNCSPVSELLSVADSNSLCLWCVPYFTIPLCTVKCIHRIHGQILGSVVNTKSLSL
jgi:hypothetical protein